MGFSVPTHNLIFIFTSNIRLPDDKEVIQAIQKATGRSKILIHRNAIRNRVRNYDIQLTDAEHWGWLYHAAHSSNTLSAMGLERPQINNILDFIWDNWHRLSEHSVRTVLKMADIYVHHAHSYTEIWKMDFLN